MGGFNKNKTKQADHGRRFAGFQKTYTLVLLVLLVLVFLIAFSTARWLGPPPQTSETETSFAFVDQTEVPQQALARKDHLVAGVQDPFEQLNPLFAQGDGENDVVSLVFEPLFAPQEGGSFLPILAQAWHYDLSERVLSITLRTDHTFPDGQVVRAEDVAFTYRLLLSQSYDGPLRGRLSALHAVFGDNDRQTVHFHFSAQVQEPDFSVFSIGIIKAHDGVSDDACLAAFKEKSLLAEGSGAFTLVEHQTNRVLLRLRSGFAGAIKSVELRQIASAAKMRLLQDGQLDVVRNIWDARMQQRARSMAGYAFFPVAQSPDQYVLVNPLRPDAGERLALLLYAAGLDLDDDQTRLLPAGQPAGLTLYFFKGLDDSVLARNQRHATTVADRLRSAGIQVEQTAVDWPELAERASKNQYDLLLWPVTADNRLPNQVTLLQDPANLDASAAVAFYKPEVFIVSNRLQQVTINSSQFPFAASRGSWTGRIENIRLIEPGG